MIVALGTIWFNWRVWKRQRAIAASRAAMSAEAFAAALAERGVSAEVAATVRGVVCDYVYARGLTPWPEDSLAELLLVDREEIEFMLGDALKRLSLRVPAERVAEMPRVIDLALYLESRRKAASRG